MKYYTVTVNGVAYDVTVEENAGPETAQAAQAPKAAPKTPPKAAAKAAAGAVQVTAGAAGKVVKILKKARDPVKKGEAIVVTEAMKMEINIVAPKDGVVASVECKVGDSIEAGAVLATMD